MKKIKFKWRLGSSPVRTAYTWEEGYRGPFGEKSKTLNSMLIEFTLGVVSNRASGKIQLALKSPNFANVVGETNTVFLSTATGMTIEITNKGMERILKFTPKTNESGK